MRQRFETPEQRQQLAEECIEVLLAWADAEAIAPAPGGPRQALQLLDGAAAVGRAFGLSSSRALHRRRAKCLDLLHDDAGARAENKQADGIAPTTALNNHRGTWVLGAVLTTPPALDARTRQPGSDGVFTATRTC